MRRPNFTPQQRAQMRAMRAGGASYEQIAISFGCNVGSVHHACVRSDEVSAAEKITLQRVTPRHTVSYASIKIDAAARMAEIPPDTRSLTGILLGDPLPGRSALFRRGATS